MAKKTTHIVPLCHRCEHRARHLERGCDGPRYQCALSSAIISCYMYRPVVPLVIKSNKGDTRPLAGPGAFSSRAHAIAVADGLEPVMVKYRGGHVIVYKVPLH